MLGVERDGKGLRGLRLVVWAGRARSICLTRLWRFPSRSLFS